MQNAKPKVCMMHYCSPEWGVIQCGKSGKASWRRFNLERKVVISQVDMGEGASQREGGAFINVLQGELRDSQRVAGIWLHGWTKGLV